MAKIMAIVGFKGSGKTLFVESLTKELIRRGIEVGVIKHTTSSYSIDTPGKDTWRYSQTGVKSSAIMTPMSTVIFLHQPAKLGRIIEILEPLDLILIEGFKEIDRIPRIILARNKSELQKLRNGLEIGVTGKITEGNGKDCDIPILEMKQIREVSDIVIEKSIPLLPGLNCGRCGFSSCKQLAKEILKGKAEASRCVNMPSREVHVILDGVSIRINRFVGRILKKVMIGILSTLKGTGTPKNITIHFQIEKK